MPVEHTDFRRVMSHFPTGITVVTTGHGDEIHGLTVNAFCSVSLRPPLILVCLNNQGYCHELIRRSGVFAVNILSDKQEALSKRFATHSLAPRERFAGIRHGVQITGAPILKDALGWLDCRLVTAYPGGDHSIFLGEIQALGHTDNGMKPLLFYRSQYHKGDLETL